MDKKRKKKHRERDKKCKKPRKRRNRNQGEKNPPILYGLRANWDWNGGNPSRDREEYIEGIADVVFCYYEDSIYRDDVEKLYLFIELPDIWTMSIGTEDAKSIYNYYKCIPLTDILEEVVDYYCDERLPDMERIKKFVDQNFDETYLDKRQKLEVK